MIRLVSGRDYEIKLLRYFASRTSFGDPGFALETHRAAAVRSSEEELFKSAGLVSGSTRQIKRVGHTRRTSTGFKEEGGRHGSRQEAAVTGELLWTFRCVAGNTEIL